MHNMQVTINYMTNKETGLLLATSNEIKGLMVHGRSMIELAERIPVAIRSILEAQGRHVDKIVNLDAEDGDDASFAPIASRFTAEISENA